MPCRALELGRDRLAHFDRQKRKVVFDEIRSGCKSGELEARVQAAVRQALQ